MFLMCGGIWFQIFGLQTEKVRFPNWVRVLTTTAALVVTCSGTQLSAINQSINQSISQCYSALSTNSTVRLMRDFVDIRYPVILSQNNITPRLHSTRLGSARLGLAQLG